MKIGIIVPFSWSYWGGVVEHSENQAAALRARGHEVKIVMGHDPPGLQTRGIVTHHDLHLVPAGAQRRSLVFRMLDDPTPVRP